MQRVSLPGYAILPFWLQSLTHAGLEAIETWRCITYRALASSTETEHDGYIEQLVTELISTMHPFTVIGEGAERDLVKIVHAAAELADAMKKCPIHYCFIYAIAPQMPVASRVINAKVWTSFKLIDVDNGENIKEPSSKSQRADMPSGELLCIIFPSLVKTMPNGAVIKLAKGVALAKLYTTQPENGKEETECKVIDEIDVEEVVNKVVMEPKLEQTKPASQPARGTWAAIVKG